ncbi:aminotransferase class I/II-fold pyridoxal phosphate-dependent enzyme [Cellulosimicrobium marinum]|uniref:aminotransferase class I/II-fold pyridoxal phosphate-dependent enzyme n=1 Tax=Cellulosimicrobium marinum TaxID=1638992 RepID=UPI001E36623C|nr:aminotransferase class I/II-fold pyridoxal phosphate-dependent enzyme [Cellulosimicrobium marinum]MCB7135590.1 aminotransferase class I/II-fold pyridoxal phosphate-dependent enzyme [Cellulosimicrobium marinum]
MADTPLRTPLDVLTLDELRRRTSVKWRAFEPDVLPLFVAEMDTAPCEPVVEAVTAALCAGDTGYDHGTAYGEAYARFAQRRWGWSFDPAATRTLPDVMVAVVEVLRVLTAPGDAVVVNPPVYPPFYGFARNEGRRVVEAPLGADLRLDLDALEAAFAEATGAAAHGRGPGSGRRAVWLVCNPHNPTGTAHTPAELAAGLALAERYGVRVVADEIHAPLTRPGLDGRPATTHTPVLTVPGSHDAVAVVSASKAFNLPGIKAAAAVAGPGAVDDLRRVPEEASHGVHHVAVLAHVAALDHGEAWLDAVLAGVERNAHLLSDLLAQHLPAVRYRPGEATYLAWLDCRALPGGSAGSASGSVPDGARSPGADPRGWFLDRARVALEDGRRFGRGGEGHVRLNLATGVDVLAEAVARMGASLSR